MDIKFLKKIEFEIIIDKLANFCETDIGKNIAFSLLPSFSFDEVKHRLNETDEVCSLIRHITKEPHFFSFYMDLYCKKIYSNQSLNLKQLLNIAHLLENSRKLKNVFFENDNIDIDKFPILEQIFSNLYSNLNIEQKIFSKIIDENTIDDKASSTLYSIRMQKRDIEKNIKDKLNSFIHSSNSKYLQEPVITIRNNRFVIPVKEEYRNLVKGLIHDVSSSGSTIFIEPLSIFESNNKLSGLKIQEEQEIEEILKMLSSLLLPIMQELEKTSNTIGYLDFIFAKAKLAHNMEAIKPALIKEKSFSFIKAKHPLIDKEKVVAIDIHLGNSFNTLVITGPNTGGKTVTLKTCGLLLVMAYCGLFITANEMSKICVFDNIFIDLGDEQSIQESLSTFSSHMTNIIYILNNATKNSLILIDELRLRYRPHPR